MAAKLNQVLAFLHPNAIPAEFHRKPVNEQRSKNHILEHDLVSFDALASIDSGRMSNDGYRIWFTDPPRPSAIKVIEYLGGIKKGINDWMFDYRVSSAFKALRRTGSLPEQVTHQFFPTPEIVARDAVEMAEIGETDTVAEPSAGQGGIADYLPRDRTTCIEVPQLHCAVLKAKGFKTICADFMDWNSKFPRSQSFIPIITFDRFVMNPPFYDGRAVAHVNRAATMLSDKGILVAVLPASYKGKQIVEGMNHEWSEVYANEFDDTSVSVVILKLKKLSIGD